MCPNKPLPKSRYATLRTLVEPATLHVLDSDALILYFPAPQTVTGEPILELHIHGGPATVRAVLAAIPKCASDHPIRYAGPGEFTRRAFQNGRLDLAQVEALSDTLSAETEQQRRAAVRGNSGSLGRRYEDWRQQLLYARGELEALIDFSEDQHFDESPAELLSSVKKQVETMLVGILGHERGGNRGELLRRGIRIALLGAPNAGKSSLLNRVVGQEMSIVSRMAGTTRDVVEVSLDVGGYLCLFADTAGLRSHGDGVGMAGEGSIINEIEEEGIRRAKAKAGEADVVVVVASVETTRDEKGFEIRFDEEAVQLAGKAPAAMLLVNKNDRVDETTLRELLLEFKARLDARPEDFTAIEIVDISCKTSSSPLPLHQSRSVDAGNITKFTTGLIAIFKSMTSLPIDSEDLLGVTERQRQLLAACREHLDDFINEAEVGVPSDDGGVEEGDCDIVVAAEHLRAAADCLSRITGRGEAGDVEEVLGVVFEK